jgi:hypothetical protein
VISKKKPCLLHKAQQIASETNLFCRIQPFTDEAQPLDIPDLLLPVQVHILRLILLRQSPESVHGNLASTSQKSQIKR